MKISILSLATALTLIPFTLRCGNHTGDATPTPPVAKEQKAATEKTDKADAFNAAEVIYSKQDSTEVETLLKQGRHTPVANRVLWFARRFLGRPYVAKTLEVSPHKEKLVVNLRELDCTTFVDVVTALTIVSYEKDGGFRDFCRQLKRQRYWQGEISDYASRNHYFSSWIENSEALGFAEEILPKKGKRDWPFTATQTLHTNYMSKHPDAYPALRADASLIKRIRTEENRLTGRTVKYIPKSIIGEPQKRLSAYIKNGDILALVTKKEGLDVAHLGFAVWQGGRLHLLNASSIYHKVVLDRNSLYKYQQQRSSQTGVRVVRIISEPTEHSNF